LEQWGILASIVDEGGFAQAATALNKSQSAVSYGVARLQEALDVPLLEVDGRRAVLTAHGKTLLKRARPLLRDLDTLEKLARTLKQGWEPDLKLVVDVAFPRERLLHIVAELQQLCPNTELQLSDAVLSGAEEAIVEQRADVVVTTRLPADYLGELLMNIMEASLATVKAGLGYAWLPAHLTAEALTQGSLRLLPLASGGSRVVPLNLVLVRPEIAGPAARAAVEIFQRHRPYN
jgi:DNA-binding transcriptional LysR family regulator